MSRGKLAFVVVATGCSSQYQSARVLAPGKTALTAAITRVQGSTGGDSSHEYFGDLQLRHGIDPKVEAGFRFIRTPGSSGANGASLVMVDGKFQLSRPDQSPTISLAFPFGIMIADSGSSFDNQGVVLAPTAFVGFTLAPTAELVFAPKLVMLYPDGGESRTDLAASLGVRFSGLARTWALQPEVSIYEPDGTSTIYLFGIAVIAGD